MNALTRTFTRNLTRNLALASLAWGLTLTGAHAASPGSLREPVPAILKDYQNIEQSLASDSLQGVRDNAEAISKAIREDQGKTVSLSAAERADKLASAQDLKAARDAFKPLSESLILYLDQNKVKNTGLEAVYCPMAKASWLQKGQQIHNPYMGKQMPGCGEVRHTF